MDYGVNDFVQRGNGSIYWDKNANSQASTKSGETYLGKTLSFNFNSHIDAKNWDGPMGNIPTGDKLTSTIKITGNENSNGELSSISAIKNVEVGETPMGKARDYYPGAGGDNNTFSLTSTKSGINMNFEQHASVSPIEEMGMAAMGYKIVDVAQKLNVNISNNNVSISAYTDIFPSASLNVNGRQIFNYSQPSFSQTHGMGLSSTPTTGPVINRNYSYYPSQLFKRNWYVKTNN